MKKEILKKSYFLFVTFRLVLLCGFFVMAATTAYGQTLSSAKINTLGKFRFMYGRLDISVKIPRTADGLWPSLRLISADYNDVNQDAYSEIILFEMGHHSGISGKNQVKRFSCGTRWGSRAKADGQTLFRNNSYALQYGEYHLITLLWTRQRIRMYLDIDKLPEQLRSQAVPYFEMAITPDLEKFFCKPFSIVLSLAAGGEYTGISGINNVTALHKDNNFQTSMSFDFVRVVDLQGNLIFNDDFRTQRIDSAKWNVEEGNGGEKELQIYKRQNVRIDRDKASEKQCLFLTIKRE